MHFLTSLETRPLKKLFSKKVRMTKKSKAMLESLRNKMNKKIYLLKESLCGLKQTIRQWSKELGETLKEIYSK